MRKPNLNTSDYPGKHVYYVWSPECVECHNNDPEKFHLTDEWSNAGSMEFAEGQPDMQGGFKGWEVQCEECGNRQVEPEYFYTDDERANEIVVRPDLPADDDTQPIDIIQ